MKTQVRRRLSGACALVLVAAVAACGSSKKASTATTAAGGSSATTAAAATTASSASAASGSAATTSASSATTSGGAAPAKANVDRKGETITVGYVNNESTAFSLPEFRIGGEVAVKYINDHGGINGAQIKLDECIADASPEGSVNCANKLVEDKVAIAYTGIDVASDAALPIYKSAGIPYVTSNSWGTAQRSDPDSFILHTAAGAYVVAPLKVLQDQGSKKIGMIVEDTPSGHDFQKNTIPPIAAKINIQMQYIVVDATNPDYASAVQTAQSGGSDSIWGQLTEPGCIGLATATSQLGYKGPVMVGSCTLFIQALKDKAVGDYTMGDSYIPEIAQYAPANIQANLKLYSDAMTAAGQTKYIGGFAIAPFGAWMELKTILETIPAGPINPTSVKAAFAIANNIPGFAGSNLHCGQKPWPTETSHCRGDILVFQVSKDASGNLIRKPVYPDFQDYSSLVK